MKNFDLLNEDYIMHSESDLILDFVNEERKRCKENDDHETLLILDKILDQSLKAMFENFKKIRNKGLNL